MQIRGLFFKGPMGVWAALPSVLQLGSPTRLSHILELSEVKISSSLNLECTFLTQHLFLPSSSLFSFLCIPSLCLTSLYPLDTCLLMVKVPLL